MLIADLVGFTARSERMDPEDVQRLLEPYHAHLRSVLERYGGTVGPVARLHKVRRRPGAPAALAGGKVASLG